MKKTITLLTLFFSLISIGQNEKINKFNKENKKTGVWKLTSKNKEIEIVTEFLDGKYVSETKYYKDKKLVALYNNDLNEIVIINDSVSTKAKFNINEDSSRNLVRIDGTEIEEEILNYFYSFSELDPEYVTGFTGFFQFIAKNFNVILNLIINYIYKHIEKYT